MELQIEPLGRMAYRAAWERQRGLVAARIAGSRPDTLILVEHDPVLTLGRRSDPAFVRASEAELAERDIEVIRVERGGEVTYHGPGQLVAYPVVHLAGAGLLLRPFVRALEGAMADTAATYGVRTERRDGYPGIWVDVQDERPRKLGALGLRVEKGVTYHGIALNIAPKLADFDLIDPCGMPGLDVTSIAREAGWDRAADASSALVEEAGQRFAAALSERLDVARRVSSDRASARAA